MVDNKKLGVEKRCAIVRRRLLNRFLSSFPEAFARRANRQNRRDCVSRNMHKVQVAARNGLNGRAYAAQLLEKTLSTEFG